MISQDSKISPLDLSRIKFFTDCSINASGYVLFTIQSYDLQETKSKVMVHDKISVMRDAVGHSPKWYRGDVYLYLQESTLVMKRVGYIDEKEIARDVVYYDVSKNGHMVIVTSEKIQKPKGYVSERIAVMDGIGPLFKESIPKKIIKSKNFVDDGWITNAVISTSGKVAYTKVSSLGPLKQKIYVDGDPIKEITGFVNEMIWADEKIVMIVTDLSKNGFFGKRDLIIMEENGDCDIIDVAGDPGDWTETYPGIDGESLAYYKDKLYFISTEGYKSVVRELDLSTLEHRILLEGDRCFHGISASNYGLALLWSNPQRSSVISIYRWNTRKEFEITSATRLPPINVSIVNDRHIILGKGEKKMFMVHGGPRSSYGLAFNFEASLYALSGFEVHLINYLGSAGFKEVSSIEEIIRDVAGYINANKGERNVLIGESFGAFIGAFILSLIDNIDTAVLERGVYEDLSAMLTSDEGIEFGMLTYKNKHPIEDPEAYVKHSPIFLANKYNASVLVVGALEDWRCPFSQSIALYNTLKYFGKDVELLVLNGSHSVKYDGSSKEKINRISKIFEWIMKKLENKT